MVSAPPIGDSTYSPRRRRSALSSSKNQPSCSIRHRLAQLTRIRSVIRLSPIPARFDHSDCYAPLSKTQPPLPHLTPGSKLTFRTAPVTVRENRKRSPEKAYRSFCAYPSSITQRNPSQHPSDHSEWRLDDRHDQFGRRTGPRANRLRRPPDLKPAHFGPHHAAAKRNVVLAADLDDRLAAPQPLRPAA